MFPTERMHLEIPVDMAASIKQLVASGAYETPDEIIYTAFLSWQDRRNILFEEINKLWDEGINSGVSPSEPIASIIAEARAELEKRS